MDLALFEIKELKSQVSSLQQERDLMSAKILILSQINTDKRNTKKEHDETLQEEIEELKENVDRKEYLLQFNEQKYHQYELVLRDLILNANTPEAVKD